MYELKLSPLEKKERFEDFKQSFPIIKVPKNFFDLEKNLQKKEIIRCFSEVENLTKKSTLNREETIQVNVIIMFFATIAPFEEFSDMILDLEPLPLIKEIMGKYDDDVIIEPTLKLINSIENAHRGINLIIKEFKKGSPLLDKILNIIYQVDALNERSITFAIFAGFCFCNLADLEFFLARSKIYSPPKLMKAIIELIKSKNTDAIRVACFLLYVLNDFSRDLKKDDFYPWRMIIEKNLLKNLMKSKINDEAGMCYLMFNLNYCAHIDPMGVGYDGILMAKKYLFHERLQPRFRAISLYSNIISTAKNKEMINKIVKEKGFFDELMKLLNETNFESLNQVARLLLNIFNVDQNNIKEFSQDQINLMLEKFVKLINLALKDDSKESEAFIRHLSNALYTIALFYPYLILKYKILNLLYQKYYKFTDSNTKGNYLSLFMNTITKISQEDALEYLYDLFKGDVENFMSHCYENTKITNPTQNLLKQNSISVIRVLVYLVQGDKKFLFTSYTQTGPSGYVDEKQDNPRTPSLICFGCKRLNASKRCGRCKIAVYCSEECQKKDWENHKLVCKKK